MNKVKLQDIWREPATQTNGFPKLMVHDDIQTGSINVRGTRLPLWAIISTAIDEGWDEVERGWELGKHYGFNRNDLAYFLYCLLEQRGEFGRLLLLLASVEKPEYREGSGWWEIAGVRNRVIKQLQRCLDALNQIEWGNEVDIEL